MPWWGLESEKNILHTPPHLSRQSHSCTYQKQLKTTLEISNSVGKSSSSLTNVWQKFSASSTHHPTFGGALGYAARTGMRQRGVSYLPPPSASDFFFFFETANVFLQLNKDSSLVNNPSKPGDNPQQDPAVQPAKVLNIRLKGEQLWHVAIFMFRAYTLLNWGDRNPWPWQRKYLWSCACPFHHWVHIHFPFIWAQTIGVQIQRQDRLLPWQPCL